MNPALPAHGCEGSPSPAATFLFSSTMTMCSIRSSSKWRLASIASARISDPGAEDTRPGFDAPPASWTKRYWGNLVIRDVPRDLWSNLPMLPDTMPCGAGLCVRKEVAAWYSELHRSGKRPFTLDRNGSSLLSGGDNDLAACACDIGLGVGVFAALHLTHLIPSNRLREEYLLDLAENIALSTVILRSFRAPSDVIQLPPFKTRAADMLRVMLMDSRARRFFRATKRGERRARQQLASLQRSASRATGPEELDRSSPNS